MKQIYHLLFLLLFFAFSNAQKGQKIGYIDMDFILRQIPSYQQAQRQVSRLSQKWRERYI